MDEQGLRQRYRAQWAMRERTSSWGGLKKQAEVKQMRRIRAADRSGGGRSGYVDIGLRQDKDNRWLRRPQGSFPLLSFVPAFLSLAVLGACQKRPGGCSDLPSLSAIQGHWRLNVALIRYRLALTPASSSLVL